MIRFNDPHGTKLISWGCGTPFVPGVYQSIARYSDRDDTLMGGVLYTDFHAPASCQIHVASFQKKWLNREMLWIIFDYAFSQVEKLVAPLRGDNEIAIAFDEHMGFKLETRVEDTFPGNVPTLIYGMYKEDCKFLKWKKPKLNIAYNLVVPNSKELMH